MKFRLLNKLPKGLSAKLLWLTVLFIMIAEVLIFVPSVANFRVNWLKERVATAQVASLALEAAPGGQLSEDLQAELLLSARVQAVALKRNFRRVLLLRDNMPYKIAAHYDLRSASFFELIVDAICVFFRTEDRLIRVVATPSHGAGESIEIFIFEAPLHEAMVRFGINILGLSIVISLIAAALVYLALNSLLIRPVARLTRNMIRFRDDPESAANIIVPSGRRDEIGLAEEELASMQGQLVTSLQQKNRLAALGLAVSKISHDLRNMLANAQLISDRFEAIDNPTVQRFAPKLIHSLDRAIRLCTETLKFGSAQEALPQRSEFLLRELLIEVGEGLGLGIDQEGPICWIVNVDDDLIVFADRDQLYRVLSNLCRNAFQVLSGTEIENVEKHIEVSAAYSDRDERLSIWVRDNGPGLPAAARENLFEPFLGVARKGGTGLGLVISAQLVRGHGGDINLLDSENGAHFLITLPGRGET